MKKEFEYPELEVFQLNVTDVMTASGYIPEEDELPWVSAN